MSEIVKQLEEVRRQYFEGAINEREYITRVAVLVYEWLNSNEEEV